MSVDKALAAQAVEKLFNDPRALSDLEMAELKWLGAGALAETAKLTGVPPSDSAEPHTKTNVPEFDDLVDRAPETPCPVAYLHAVWCRVENLREQQARQNLKNVQRQAQLDKLTAELSPELPKWLRSLEERIFRLEHQPHVRYRGAFADGEVYPCGSVVSTGDPHPGVWLAIKDGVDGPPGSDPESGWLCMITFAADATERT